jgi:hypothetical protein
MGLDEPLSKTRNLGAGIVLIGMHRFAFTHDRCCPGLSGAEQGWPAWLANGRIYQLHALGLSLSAFCPDAVYYLPIPGIKPILGLVPLACGCNVGGARGVLGTFWSWEKFALQGCCRYDMGAIIRKKKVK